ncbi:MAG: protein kinase, partial [Acidobacteria bacterium]|nr:protein kinase [Acidobacteriota bacterium]
AQDTKLNRKVAIKFLNEEFSTDADKLDRFVQEAQSVSALNHPHILTIYEIGEVDGTQYIATELIEGKTLREHIEGDDMSLVETLKIIKQIADALSAAHEAHIIHRDIKPENIMIRKDGYAKILDFGLAKPVKHLSGGEDATVQLIKTNPGMVMGSVRYMSPEQARGKETDARTDIWSLGVVLYEMVTGRNPFVADNIGDSMVAVINKEPEEISQYVSNAPDFLQEIISKTLQKDAVNRYAEMEDFASDIKKLRFELEHNSNENKTVRLEAGSGENETVIQKAGVQLTTEEQNDQTKTKISGTQAVVSGIRQHKLGAAAAFIVAVIVLSGFGYGLYKFISGQDETKPVGKVGELKSRRITGDGKTSESEISPDGKLLAYRTENSLRIKQIETNSEVEVVPKDEFKYFASLVFSPDGNFIYFNGEKEQESIPSIYRTPTLGGRTEKILSDGWGVSFSPDGKQIAFARGNADGVEQSYYIANADGTEQRKVVSLRDKTRFFAIPPSWSPDGKFLAAGLADDSLLPKPRFVPIVISLSDGTYQKLGERHFLDWGGIKWHPDGRTLYFNGKESTDTFQIWEFQYPNGESRAVTPPLINYGSISLTADGQSISAIESKYTSSIWISPDTDPKNAKQVMPDSFRTNGFAWTPDGRIVYVSDQSGDQEIWIMDKTGENSKQLTNDRKAKSNPFVSADGGSIVYFNPFNGEMYQMDIDGGNLLNLPEPGLAPTFSPDGKWIIYHQWISTIGFTVFRMPRGGGKSERLTDYVARYPRYSPDGKYFVCQLSDQKAQSWDRLAIVQAAGGIPEKILELPSGSIGIPRWTPDGKGITYFNKGIRAMPIDGGESKKLEIPENRSTGLQDYEFSLDGKQIGITLSKRTSNAVLITNFR